MAKRAWMVPPDHMVETVIPDGEGGWLAGEPLAAVSKNALIEAAVDAAIMCHRAGGVYAVTTIRRPTGAPNEYATVGATVEWKDRSDARAQPEETGVVPVSAPAPPPPAESAAEADEELPVELVAVGAAEDGDEEAVDESSIPQHLRSS